MNLLVLAQTPPPVHGQCIMVQAAVEGLPRNGLKVHHVNLRLSRHTADIGHWRWGKIGGTFSGAFRAIAARCSGHADTLYYIPAPPAKRGAFYRDLVILALCRPFFPRLVLHWHAVGLGAWLAQSATPPERWLGRWLLGRADLAIVLAPTLAADAQSFHPRRTVVVPNGIPDPGPVPRPPAGPPFRVLFLATCREDKGLFAAATAVIAANQERAPASSPSFVLEAAGPFDSEATAARWRTLVAQHPSMLREVGPVDGDRKRECFARAHVLCLPTRYAAEGLPLVALEALAHDRPVLATDWRGLPAIVSADVGRLVPVGDAAALLAALLELQAAPPRPGVCRARFEERFTRDRHLAMMVAALSEI